MIIYIDTEFTDLVKDNKLISIALVDDNEEFFYAELTDTYTLGDCSGFVKTDVLPLLLGGHHRMTRAECSVKILNWITSRKAERCLLGCDNPNWDLPHLRNLLGDLWPANLEKAYFKPVMVPSDIQEQLVASHGFKIHNALDDALIMKLNDDRLKK